MVCSSGVSFNPVLHEKLLTFEFYGLYEAVLVMFDRETETVWTHLSGEGLTGKHAGKRLEFIPSLNTTWGEWKKLHPATTTLSFDTPQRQYYQRQVVSGSIRNLSPEFTNTLSQPVTRLPKNTLLVATLIGGKARGYLYDDLRAGAVIEETYKEIPVSVWNLPNNQGAAAFDRRLDGATHAFALVEVDGEWRFRDAATGSTWTIQGECIAGKLRGKQLTRLVSSQSEWYGWAAYFPSTTIYGQDE